MSFNALFLAYAPDADKDKHRCTITTDKYYNLNVVVVRNLKEAVQVCSDMVRTKNLDIVLLCPGFTHPDVAEIVKAAGNKVSVCVSREDWPGNEISAEARKREGIPEEIERNVIVDNIVEKIKDKIGK